MVCLGLNVSTGNRSLKALVQHSSRPPPKRVGKMHTMQASGHSCKSSTTRHPVTNSRSAKLIARAVQQIRLQDTDVPAAGTAAPAAGTAALSFAAAATALQLILPTAAPAVVVLAAEGPVSPTVVESRRGGVQPVGSELSAAAAPSIEAEADDILDDMTEDVALPPELMRFMEMITNGPVKSVDQLQDARRAVGFERTPDGRVLLMTEDGEPFQVKADMGVPGMLLLRDAGGYLYYLPRDEEGTLQQIDLSDDAVVAQLFANHAWEELVEPLEVIADDVEQQRNNSAMAGPEGEAPTGRLEQLRLSERQFRSVVSLLAGGQELPEEPLEDLDKQEQPQQQQQQQK